MGDTSQTLQLKCQYVHIDELVKQIDLDSAPAGEAEPGGPGALAGHDHQLNRPGQPAPTDGEQQLQQQGRRQRGP